MGTWKGLRTPRKCPNLIEFCEAERTGLDAAVAILLPHANNLTLR